MSPTIRNGRGERATFDLSLRASPPSPVERRVLTAAELAARGVPERPSPLAPVRVPLVTLADPPVIAPSPEEAPVIADPAPVTPASDADRADAPETLGDSLAILTDATRVAEEAWRQLADARATVDVAQAFWTSARATMEKCWHRTWAGLQLAQARDIVGSTAERRHERLLERPYEPPANVGDVLARREALRDAFGDAAASVALDNDPEYGTHSIGDGHDHGELSNSASSDEAEPVDDAPEVVTSAPIRGGRATLESGLTRRQEQVLEVVSRLGGDRSAAARELGVVYQSIDATLESIAKRGKLPVDLLAKLPARFAQVPSR